MKRSTKSILYGSLAVLIYFIMLIAAFGVSWIATCGLIKLITLCFGWTFSWSIATGIWLIMLVILSLK